MTFNFFYKISQNHSKFFSQFIRNVKLCWFDLTQLISIVLFLWKSIVYKCSFRCFTGEIWRYISVTSVEQNNAEHQYFTLYIHSPIYLEFFLHTNEDNTQLYRTHSVIKYKNITFTCMYVLVSGRLYSNINLNNFTIRYFYLM